MESLFRGSDWYGALCLKIDSIVPHPDPETTGLEIARVLMAEGDPLSGIPIVVKKGEFEAGGWAVYTGIDSIVPTTGRFSFLDPKGRPHKVKAKKLRGVFSEGLLTPACALNPDEQSQEAQGKLCFSDGADLTVALGITKFITEGEAEPAEYELVAEEAFYSVHDLVQYLFDKLARREAGPAWCWLTPEKILRSIKAAGCTVECPSTRG